MILWHLGATVLVVRYVYRDPAMDLRWVLGGALLPDLVDKPIGAVVFNGHFGTHRVFGHTLLLAVVLLSAAVTFTSRRSGRRKALIGLVIGMLLHLVLDGVWSDPATFLWPAFGWTFPAMQPAELGPLVGQMVRDPLVWAGEAAGVSYLVFLERRRLRDAAARRAFLRHGVIPLRA